MTVTVYNTQRQFMVCTNPVFVSAQWCLHVPHPCHPWVGAEGHSREIPRWDVDGLLRRCQWSECKSLLFHWQQLERVAILSCNIVFSYVSTCMLAEKICAQTMFQMHIWTHTHARTNTNTHTNLWISSVPWHDVLLKVCSCQSVVIPLTQNTPGFLCDWMLGQYGCYGCYYNNQ